MKAFGTIIILTITALLNGCVIGIGKCEEDGGQIDIVQTWPDTLELRLQDDPYVFYLDNYYCHRKGYANRYVAGADSEKVATVREFDSELIIQTISEGQTLVWISWGATDGGLECRSGGRDEFILDVKLQG